MNQSLVARLSNTVVYLISDKNISYYLSVPINNSGKISIAINIMDNINNSNVSGTYQMFDNQNICLISPLLDKNILFQMKTQNEQVYQYADKCISYLINAVYKMMSNNNRNVDGKIILIKNDAYILFENWFTTRYKDRVECREFNTPKPNPETPIQNIQPQATIPVVDTVGEQKASAVLDNTKDIVTNNEQTSTTSNEPKDLGFVSYVLLGVVVAVVSLVILYMLI